MADLSHLSDDQLVMIAQGKTPATPDLGHLTDDQLAKIASQGTTKMGMGKAAAIQGEAGALLGLRPFVAGLGAGAGAFTGTKGSFGDKLGAAKDAFVEGRADANQEQNQASTDHPYISTAANVGGSLLTLPMLPAKGLAGALKLGAGLGAAQAAGSANSLGEAAVDIGGGAALGGAAYGAGKVLSKGASAIANSEIGQKAKDLAKKTLMSVPSELTGIADKEIEAYATRADKVNKIFQESGGDASIAAKHAKQNILNDVNRTRQALNVQISEALQNASPEKTIGITPVLDSIRKYKERINIDLEPEKMNQINELQNRIMSVVGKYGDQRTAGKVSISELQQIKNFLREAASPSYGSTPLGFKVGGEAANAAKAGAAEAKSLLDKFGPVEIKNANRQLQQLHEIEDHMGNNLLNPHAKNHGDIYAVGGGFKNNNSQALNDLGQITGQDYLQGASDLAAAKTFGAPKLFAEIKTGRALLGPAVGTSIGGAAGAFMGGAHGAFIGGQIGGGIGTILSSPRALKLAIDTGRVTGQVLSKVSQALGVTPGNLTELYQVLQSPQAQEIFIRAMSEDNKAAASQAPPASVDTAMKRRLSK
jgi:hypothetical protein